MPPPALYMHCAICHQKEATVHITTIVDGAQSEPTHLCVDCAATEWAQRKAAFGPGLTVEVEQKSTSIRLYELIGLVGDYDPGVAAHQAIPGALKRAARQLRRAVSCEWVPTTEITSAERVAKYDGLWCVPASPYRRMDGALLAVRYAREHGIPFLGTCGGFQHAVLEYAQNVLGWSDADHAETAPQAARPVIAPLACALIESTGAVRLFPGTRIAAAYGRSEVTETYHCRYGLNPVFQAALLAGPLRAAAEDAAGQIRAVELDNHPFFVGTLFQPERAALRGESAPLVEAFLGACAQRRTGA
jgi:CTP synthase (UTP-ammonia lyase)